MKTRTYQIVKQQFDENVRINTERLAMAEARIEAERQAKEAEKLAKEERRKLRQMKKSEKQIVKRPIDVIFGTRKTIINIQLILTIVHNS